MKRLFEIVAEKAAIQAELNHITVEFDKKKKILNDGLAALAKLENVAQDGHDVIMVQLAESVLTVVGNPYGITDQRDPSLASRAIVDIAMNTPHLRGGYYGNKRYDGYYQESSHPYNYGPKHGSINDEIGLRPEARVRDLTDDEKDACIYYLKNYVAIKASKAKV